MFFWSGRLGSPVIRACLFSAAKAGRELDDKRVGPFGITRYGHLNRAGPHH